MRFGTENYPVFLLLGLTLWRFFAIGTTSAMRSIVGKGHIIKKIYFPREVLVLSAVISAFISTSLEFVVFFFIFFLFGLKFSISFLILPIILILEFVLVLGVGLIISTLFVFYRDYNDIWEITLHAGFFLTPIIWPISILGENSRYLPYILINPMSRVVTMSRDMLLNGKIPQLMDFAILSAMCALVFLAGCLIFKKYEQKFAREV
jgi:lipopolysaccharide transport system permease protein